jgi:predicted nuclease of predicted toxin-antitoxin system
MPKLCCLPGRRAIIHHLIFRALRFLLDMGVSYKVADWLNDSGHDAIHLSQQGLHKMGDDLIIEKALEEDRIILTADMDFAHILTFKKSNMVSVIQFRLFDLSPTNLIEKLAMIFEKVEGQFDQSSLIITVQEHKIRFKNTR